jgi:hypothetical protein
MMGIIFMGIAMISITFMEYTYPSEFTITSTVGQIVIVLICCYLYGLFAWNVVKVNIEEEKKQKI